MVVDVDVPGRAGMGYCPCMRRLLTALPLLLACASTQPAKSAAARCPGSNDLCLSGTDCSYDRARDCTLCICRRADGEKPREGNAAKAYPETERGPSLPPIR